MSAILWSVFVSHLIVMFFAFYHGWKGMIPMVRVPIFWWRRWYATRPYPLDALAGTVFMLLGCWRHSPFLFVMGATFMTYYITTKSAIAGNELKRQMYPRPKNPWSKEPPHDGYAWAKGEGLEPCNCGPTKPLDRHYMDCPHYVTPCAQCEEPHGTH